jgi:hypothetical protein
VLTPASPLPTAPTTGRFRTDPLPSSAVFRAVTGAKLSHWRVRAITDTATRCAIRDLHVACWDAHLLASGGARTIALDEPAGAARQLRRDDQFVRQLHEAPLHLAILARKGGTLRPGSLDELIAALAREQLGAVELPRLTDCTSALEDLLDLPAQGLMLSGMLIAGARW